MNGMVAMFFYLKKLTQKIFCASVLWLLAGTSVAVSLSLKDAVFLALRNNPSIQSNELDRVVQKYALVVAKHAFQPNYALEASYQNQSTTSNGATTLSNSFNVAPSVALLTGYGTQFKLSADNEKLRHGHYQPSVTLEIVQPLLRGFGKDIVEASLRNAFDQEEINQIQLKQSVSDTIDQVVRDYLAIVSAQENFKISEASLKAYTQTVENDRLMIGAGRKAKADIVQAEAQLATQRVQIEDSRQTMLNSKFQLLNDLGLDRETKIEIPTTIDFEGIVWQLLGKRPLMKEKAGIEGALANNFVYRVSRIALQQLGRDLNVAKDNQRWKLNLDVSQAVGNGSGGGDNSGIPSLMSGKNSNRSVSLNLNVPIDDINAKQDLLSKEVSIQQSKIQLEAKKRSVEMDAINRRNSVISSEKQWLLSVRALDLQKQTVEVNTLKQKLGRISTFELLKTQQDLTAAEQDVISKAIGHIQAVMTLNNLLGTTLDVWGIRMTEDGSRLTEDGRQKTENNGEW